MGGDRRVSLSHGIKVLPHTLHLLGACARRRWGRGCNAARRAARARARMRARASAPKGTKLLPPANRFLGKGSGWSLRF